MASSADDPLTEIDKRLQELSQRDPESLQAFLYPGPAPAYAINSRLRLYVRPMAVTANGVDRTPDLAEELALYAVDFAIPRQQIRKAKEKDAAKGNNVEYNRIARQARRFFTSQKNTGEGEELLLYILLEQVLGFPQILTKMDIKTDTEMHVHGADGVHVSVSHESGHLKLYWGESKLYQRLGEALNDCLESLSEMVSSPENTPVTLNQDVSLLHSRLPQYVDDPELVAALSNFLNPRHYLFNEVLYCGAGLVGYDASIYKNQQIMGNKIQQSFHENANAQIRRVEFYMDKHGIRDCEVHLFLIPQASVDKLRRLFVEAVKG